jgi:hypothetical protein
MCYNGFIEEEQVFHRGLRNRGDIVNPLSDQAKEELLHALEGRQTGLFVIEGKLVSVEVEDFDPVEEDVLETDLAQEIEDDPELKASLQRYLDNPSMRGYTADELKEKRRDRRG